MDRAVDALSLVLLALGGAALVLGQLALAEQRDLGALYWLVVGALLLRSATELLRPRS